MPKLLSSICLFCSVVLATMTATISSVSADDVVSNAFIDRAGLTVDWFTHTGIGVRGQLVDWHLNVNENKPTTHFTIEAGSFRESFSQNKLNPFGEPMGVDGAVAYVEMRKEILAAEMENDGVKEPKIDVKQYTLPMTTIYTLTSDALVKAIDADTGKTRWSTKVGSAAQPSIGIGSSDKYVAAINGSTLYLLESETGKVLWSIGCRDAVAASPAVSDERVYVPLINGRLEAFSIEDKGVNSTAFVVMGQGTSRPLITERVVAWPDQRGVFSIAGRFNTKAISYQLRSDDGIVCSPVYDDGIFYVTSLDGFVYAMEEKQGSLLWQASTGRSISESPVVHQGFVFVINENNEMFKFNSKTGLLAAGWKAPRQNVKKFLGASKDNLYVLDRFGQLIVISQANGSTLSSVKFGDVSNVLPNIETDRIFVASRQGMIQCIRERQRPIPYFHRNDEFGPGEMTVSTKSQETDSKKEAMDMSDPFGSSDPGDNPFGGPSGKGSDSDDPFGGPAKSDDNPFGNSSSGSNSQSADDDPFK
ncbi:MAG: PQQ-binding-like beta-propeller repeat protein [Planctomycetota bacterium]